MASSSKKRNGTLEFMRFVFCLTILLFHMGKMLLGGFSFKNGIQFAFFPHGAMGVEFFFILTGLFLAQSVDKQLQRAEKKTNIIVDTLQYFSKKYTSTFPQHVVAFAVLFGVTVLVHLDTPGWSAWDRFDSAVPSLFLIQMTGIMGEPLNHIEWYLSAMLIAILIIYPLCRLNFKVFTRYIAPVVSVALFIWMRSEYPSLSGVTRQMNITADWYIYKGVVRAVAEITLGTFVYSLSKYGLAPFVQKIGKPARAALTAVEWIMYAAAVLITVLTLPYKWEYAALAVIFVGITLSFSGLTYSGKLLDNNFSYFLGKITLPVYLSQLSAIAMAGYYLADYSGGMKIWGALVLTAVSSAITMIVGNFIGNLFGGKFFKKKEKTA